MVSENLDGKPMYGGPLEAYLRVWTVEEIKDGTIAIGEIWARKDKHLVIFRSASGEICSFGEPGFAFNEYGQFHFTYDGKYLVSRNIEPGIHLTVGFQDEKCEKVFFRFSGRAGLCTHNDPWGDGWGGGGNTP